MATNPVPPVPYKVQMLDRFGFIQPVWAAWFREVLNRVGGSIAPSNSELGQDQATVTGAIEDLQDETESLQDQITNINSGLGQGRDL